VQALNGIAIATLVSVVIPLGYQVAKRATLVAERNAAVHAATSLSLYNLAVTLLINLFPVHDTNRNWPTRSGFAFGYL
jgi:hypothetical protein